MKTLRYQQKAVKDLIDKTILLLSLKGNRKTLVFKAPTGAGKTVMASEMLLRLQEELRTRPDSPFSEVAFMWIAPNKLHEQSYFKMKSYFSETKELRPVIYDELDTSADGYIKAGEILFVNWESINKDNAVMIRDTERSASLYDIARRTQQDNEIPIIAIIDEEHMFAGKNAKKSQKVLQTIQPKVEIRISATPETISPDEMVNIPRDWVIAEEMIKEGIVLNPDLDFNTPLGSLNQHLINLALKKREELADAYKKLGVNINPLLLIQLPNDEKETMSADDNAIREEVEQYLDVVKGINTQNGKLGIWLSGEKTDNLEHIEVPNDLTEVLLFKQAIALGWDCPRAAVLLIFRKVESFTFTAQTVGRILRMPEQRYYEDDRLNKGYVYTDVAKEKITICKDDMGYISKLIAKRREDLNNIVLTSEYCERPASDRKRLGIDFKQYLISTFERLMLNGDSHPMLFSLDELLGYEPVLLDKTTKQGRNRDLLKDRISFNVKSILIEIIEDLNITGEVGTTIVKSKAKYVRTMQELNQEFLSFCYRCIGTKFEKVSVLTLANNLKEVLEELFGLFETEAIKVVLETHNQRKFENFVIQALVEYLGVITDRQKKKAEKSFTKYKWEVPADRIYAEDTHSIQDEVKNHALMPFVELNAASNPEERFTVFLEANTEYIDWWYKNGDSGKQHYSISYINVAGEKSLFYVDFVIRMKNGQIFLFDTKSCGSDVNAPAKHNALIEYINSEENKGKNLKGGVIIEQGLNWKYCPLTIENTTEITSWDCFYPNEYK